MLTVYEKAAAIAAKLESIAWEIELTPEMVLKKASIQEINFYYYHIFGGEG